MSKTFIPYSHAGKPWIWMGGGLYALGIEGEKISLDLLRVGQPLMGGGFVVWIGTEREG